MMITHNVNTFQKITDAFKENGAMIHLFIIHVKEVETQKDLFMFLFVHVRSCSSVWKYKSGFHMSTVRQLFAQYVYIKLNITKPCQ